MTARSIRPAELVRRTHQALTALYSASTTEDNLTLPQMALMEALRRHGPQRGRPLMSMVGMDRSTMFSMIERLRDAGLVVAVQVESDKPGPRPHAVSLTPKGIRALNRSESFLWNAEVNLMSKLTPHEKGVFLNALAVTAFSGPKP